MAATDLPLQLIDLTLKHLDLVSLEGDPNLPILLSLLQCFQTMDQLPLLVAILLCLHRQGLLPLLTTVHMFIQCRKVFVDPLEYIGYLCHRGLFQHVFFTIFIQL